MLNYYFYHSLCKCVAAKYQISVDCFDSANINKKVPDYTIDYEKEIEIRLKLKKSMNVDLTYRDIINYEKDIDNDDVRKDYYATMQVQGDYFVVRDSDQEWTHKYTGTSSFYKRN